MQEEGKTERRKKSFREKHREREKEITTFVKRRGEITLA